MRCPGGTWSHSLCGSTKKEITSLVQVVDLAFALESMGAEISGIGSRCITVQPAQRLVGLDWTVIPDRIEAGTYLQAAAITGSSLTVTPCVAAHMEPVCDLLQQIGCKLEKCDSAACWGLRNAVSVCRAAYNDNCAGAHPIVTANAALLF